MKTSLFSVFWIFQIYDTIPTKNILVNGKELQNEATMLQNDLDHYLGSEATITGSILAYEARTVKEDIVFGIVTSAEALEIRIELLKLWWLPGSTGCVYFDETMISGSMRMKLPRGMDVCFTPDAYLLRPWYQKYSRQQRGALLSLVLWRHYPGRRWYAIGQDDTMFSPLALAQWLNNFDPFDEWYIGGKSENQDIRKNAGYWDIARSGGGFVLSSGLLENSGGNLEKCFEVVQWAKGSDWALGRCFGRIGVPITQALGMHAVDVYHDNWPEKNYEKVPVQGLQDIIERHPVAPFISLHHPSRVFSKHTGYDQLKFFKAMYRDPIGFLQLSVCEINTQNKTYSLALTSGVSVRLWPRKVETLLWESLRMDVLEPSAPRLSELLDAPIKFKYRTSQPQVKSDGIVTTVYSAKRTSNPFQAVVVAEERQEKRWLGAPRRSCHAGTREVVYKNQVSILVLALRDCHIPKSVNPKYPSESDLSSMISETLSIKSRPLKDLELNTDRAFLPPEQFGAGGVAFVKTAHHSSSENTASVITKYEVSHVCSKLACSDTSFAFPADGLWGHGHQACASRTASPLDGTCPILDRSWFASNEYCSSVGARLCSLQELSQGLGYDTGCDANNAFIWSSSMCGSDAYYQFNQRKLIDNAKSTRRCVPEDGGGAYFSSEGSPVCCADIDGCVTHGRLLREEEEELDRNSQHFRMDENKQIMFEQTKKEAEKTRKIEIIKDNYHRKYINELKYLNQKVKNIAPSSSTTTSLMSLNMANAVSHDFRNNNSSRCQWLNWKHALVCNNDNAAPSAPAARSAAPPQSIEAIAVNTASANPATTITNNNGGVSGTVSVNVGEVPHKAGGGGKLNKVQKASKHSPLNHNPNHNKGANPKAHQPEHHPVPLDRGPMDSSPPPPPPPPPPTSVKNDVGSNGYVFVSETDMKSFNNNNNNNPFSLSSQGVAKKPVPPPIQSNHNNRKIDNLHHHDNNNGGEGGGRSSGYAGSGNKGQNEDISEITRLPSSFLLANRTVKVWRPYLGNEEQVILQDVAFGLIGSTSTLISRVFLLKHWWLPGAVGCLYVERGLSRAVEKKIPIGLDVCFTPEDLRLKNWYQDDNRATVRGGIIPMVTWRHFPNKKWYVIGDDDTMFSPLALGQVLQKFDSNNEVYIGARSENPDIRLSLGWDMGFGGGGILLSAAVLNRYGSALERCYDDSLWDVAPGGDWILHRCLSRLGIPLTAHPGMHQLDSNSPVHTKDIIERHPVAPFISLHHPSRVFTSQTGLDHAAFFRGMYHDPVNFLQFLVCEAKGLDSNYTIAVSSGLSVRIWTRTVHALLWDQTKVDTVVPYPASPVPLYNTPEARYVLANIQHEGLTHGLSVVTLYTLEKGNKATSPYQFVVVAEERIEQRWLRAPRKLCHVATHEINYDPGKVALSTH